MPLYSKTRENSYNCVKLKTLDPDPSPCCVRCGVLYCIAVSWNLKVLQLVESVAVEES
jgi:hypothetical protein